MLASKDIIKISSLIIFAIFLLFNLFYLKFFTGGVSNRTEIYNEEHYSTIETQFKKDSNMTMNPVVILWTNWKSGSSFVGHLLTASDPSIFYSYEPLHPMGVKIIQKKNKKDAQFAIERLKEVMNCQFNSSYFTKYYNLKFLKNIRNPFIDQLPVEKRRNTKLIQTYCVNRTKKKVLKVLRLTLDVAESVLNINNNIKILYMVRDPRATVRSRRNTNFCPKNKECSDVKRFCSYLKIDSEVIRPLLQKYPKRFKAMRYEDLSLDPEKYYKQLLKFLGEDYTNKAQNLYKSLNKRTDTRKHTFHWKDQMSFNDAYQVQTNCTQTLEYFGYRLYESKEDYIDLDPLLPKSDIFI